MKISVEPGAFRAAAQLAANMAASSTTLPILQNVLIDATGDSIRCMATEMESYVIAPIDKSAGEIQRPGRCTVPGRVLVDAIRDLPNETLVLDVDGTRAKLFCGKVKFQLATMPADEFPEWPEFKPQRIAKIGSARLASLLQRALVAVPAKDPRKVMTGVFIDLRRESTWVVGSDGKRLIVAQLDAEWQTLGAEAKDSYIMPGKVATEIARQLPGANEPVEIMFGERQVAVEFADGTRYVSNLVEGNFPRWEMIVAKDFDKIVSLDRSALLSNIRRSGAVQDRAESRVILNVSKGVVKVTSFATEVGEFESEMDAEYDGKPFTVCFNANYFCEVAKAMPSDAITLNVNAVTSPVVLKSGVDPEDIYLVMPIKVTAVSLGDSAEVDDGEED